MYEARDTSANKTHLFNWLYGAAAQMTLAYGCEGDGLRARARIGPV